MINLPLTRDEAIELLRKYNSFENEADWNHFLESETIMKELAERLGEDNEYWGMLGLLHDIDWGITKNNSVEHLTKAPQILRDIGFDEEFISQIVSHGCGFECAGLKDKKRTKTADHEAIPRFEMLTDLGLLEKKIPEDSGGDIEKARKSWTFWATPLLSDFASRLPDAFSEKFYWLTFSQASCAFSSKLPAVSLKNDYVAVASRVNDAYLTVKRPFGHTPLESIALVAMIRASAGSESIELNDIHQLFLDFKRKGILANTVRFAAGNDLDRMFVDIRSDFVDEVKRCYGKEAELGS